MSERLTRVFERAVITGVAAGASVAASLGIAAFFGRLGKGLLAGLVLGHVYMFLLNAILNSFVPPQRLYERYVYEMWQGGLPAMGVASAPFRMELRR